MRNSSKSFGYINILQLILRHFVSMQSVCNVLMSTLLYQQPINSAAQNNHTLILLTVSYNEINLS